MRLLLLFVALLGIVWSYPQNYYDEYNYDEENYVDEWDNMLENPPEFIASDQRIVKLEGQDATFDCSMDRDSNHVLLFGKKIPGSENMAKTLIFVGDIQINRDIRFVKKSSGNDHMFMLNNLMRDDAGEYMCYIEGNNPDNPAKMVTYTLEVHYQAAIKITSNTETYLQSRGGSAILNCVADGFPEPVVTWSRRDGGPLPKGVEESGGSLLFGTSFEDVDICAEGTYICRAENGIANPYADPDTVRPNSHEFKVYVDDPYNQNKDHCNIDTEHEYSDEFIEPHWKFVEVGLEKVDDGPMRHDSVLVYAQPGIFGKVSKVFRDIGVIVTYCFSKWF